MCLCSLLLFGENCDLGGIVDLGRQRNFYLHSRSKTCFVENDYMETLYYVFCSLTYLFMCVLLCKYHMAKGCLCT